MADASPMPRPEPKLQQTPDPRADAPRIPPTAADAPSAPAMPTELVPSGATTSAPATAAGPSTSTSTTASAPAPHIYTKRNLPSHIHSIYPHGLITNEPRTAEQQAAFDVRKQDAMRKHSLAELQALYDAETAQLCKTLERDKEENDKVLHQIEVLTQQRELERRIYANLRGKREGKGKGGASGLGLDTVGDGAASEKGEVEGVARAEVESLVKMEVD